MSRSRVSQWCVVLTLVLGATTVAAQTPAPTRRAEIEQEQAEKAKTLHPYIISTGERWMNKVEDITVNGGLHWHPFFDSAYHGGGFALGAGYMHHVSPYNLVDVRGNYSIRGYTRAEVEFKAPRMFQRRATLSVLGGYREATQVAYYGAGNNTSTAAKTNYSFKRPYASALMTLWPMRKWLMLRGGLELTQWDQNPGEGSSPSVETVYTPETLPGLGAKVNYFHSQGTIGFDWRDARDYSRRGGFYGITLHDYRDRDELFGFQQVDYEAIEHFPILRESWVISLHGLAQTTLSRSGQQVPFFMQPSLGGGDDLRGYTSWLYRDRHSLILQAEWRIMVNRFMDTAVFYDAGKVAARTSDIDVASLKHDYGFGVRFHSPLATHLRIDLAKSPQDLILVFAGSAPF
jgi:outer membrane protein assembly factor BamA